MPVSLDKVAAEAPHLVDLTKHVGVTLTKFGHDASKSPAAVIATFDNSGSTSQLYASGRMGMVADIATAAGLQLDDDGQVPASLFDTNVKDLGEITLTNCKDFLTRSGGGRNQGGTNYLRALRWIVQTAGYGNVDLGHGAIPATTKRGFLGRKHEVGGSPAEPLRVRATAKYPTLAIFVTDGEPTDNEGKPAIIEYLTRMSQLPIFVQCVGIADREFSFPFLEQIDELPGSLVDSVGFFNSWNRKEKRLLTVDEMVEAMLKEFPSYYSKARQIGLVTG